MFEANRTLAGLKLNSKSGDKKYENSLCAYAYKIVNMTAGEVGDTIE